MRGEPLHPRRWGAATGWLATNSMNGNGSLVLRRAWRANRRRPSVGASSAVFFEQVDAAFAGVSALGAAALRPPRGGGPGRLAGDRLSLAGTTAASAATTGRRCGQRGKSSGRRRPLPLLRAIADAGWWRRGPACGARTPNRRRAPACRHRQPAFLEGRQVCWPWNSWKSRWTTPWRQPARRSRGRRRHRDRWRQASGASSSLLAMAPSKACAQRRVDAVANAASTRR